MTAPSSIDPARFLHDQLESASPDLLRSMLTTFINTLMSAEADAVCGAPYGVPSADRVNVRNGYRHPGLRHPCRHPGRGDPQAALGQLFPGLAARAPPPGRGGSDVGGGDLCVPKTSSTSCDQAIFVDQATDASVSSDAILIEVGRPG
jgi:hypothetical protein